MNLLQPILRELLALILIAGFFTSFGQYLDLKSFGRYDSIKVEAFGKDYRFPWVGGFNTPQFSAADLNQDGNLDLFVFDRDGFVVRTFINGGTPNTIDYDYNPDYEFGFPLMWDYGILYDYNQDGKHDLFTSYNGDFRVFNNLSTSGTPQDANYKLRRFKSPYDSTQKVDFLSHKYFLSANNYIYTNVFNGNADFPALVDIDDDGDMDIFAFGNNSNSVGFYKNISQETYGVPDSLDFRFITGCWGHFAEDNFTFRLYLADCKRSGISVSKSNPMTFSSGSRHEGSTVLIHDFDANGQKDIALGDVDYNSVVVAFNNGTTADANMTAQDTAFPRYNKPVDVQRFPANFMIDIDNDGIKDFISAPNAEDLFININQVHYYKNLRQTNLPNLSFQGNDFLVGDMIDVGTNAYPLLIDIDGDTLLDILLGNRGVFSSIGVYESRIVYFKNIGTKTNPSFELITRDFLSLPNGVDTGLYPTAGDLDNDGDIDLLMGTERGNLYFYENVASSPTDSCQFMIKSMPFSSKIFGKSLRPFLYDINKDGKLDVLCGDQTDGITYYKNIGTASSPDFDPNQATYNFGGLRSKNQQGNGYLSPFMAKLDTNGAYDSNGKEYLFAGTGNGYLYVLSDLDTVSRTQGTVVDSFYVYAREFCITGGDLTGDNKMDLIYGHKTGGLSVLLKDGGNIIVQPPKEEHKDTISVMETSQSHQKIQVYPNPTNGSVTIQGLELDVNYNSVLFDINGTIVWEGELLNGKVIDLEHMLRGVYFLQIDSPETHQSVKIVKH